MSAQRSGLESLSLGSPKSRLKPLMETGTARKSQRKALGQGHSRRERMQKSVSGLIPPPLSRWGVSFDIEQEIQILTIPTDVIISL